MRTIEPFGFTKVSALGVEEQRVNVIADFVSSQEDWQRLGGGYRVEARFVLWEDEDVLQVPTSSLFRLNDGGARQRVVKMGASAGGKNRATHRFGCAGPGRGEGREQGRESSK